jgi:protocatechuate 3,4-dioxygenase beta subunit
MDMGHPENAGSLKKRHMKKIDRAFLRHKCINIILVFLITTVFGVILAVTSSAQLPGLSSIGQASGNGISGDNLLPVIASLTPDKSSPQEEGAVIKWKSRVFDPEGDAISYKFQLQGPSTGGAWNDVTDWSGDNSWTWTTTTSDIGQNQVRVLVRDGKHAGPDGFDAMQAENYEITAPAPAQSPRRVGAPITGPATTPVSTPVSTPMETSAQVPASSAGQQKASQNTPPAIRSLSASPVSPLTAGVAVTWTADARDPDGDKILYRFFLTGPSTGSIQKAMTDWTADSTWTWKTTEADIGQNQIEVWVRDGNHAGADSADDRRSAAFTISAPAAAPAPVPMAPINRPPAISRLTPDMRSPQDAGTTITWTANAADPDGDQILYRFFLNGQPMTDWTAENKWVWETTDANVGNSQVEVWVRDGMHADPNNADDRKSASYTINALAPMPAASPKYVTSQQNATASAMPSTPAGIARQLQAANQPPAIQSLTSDKPSPQAAGTVVNWTARATDPDGDQILYRFFLNGQPVTSWTTDDSWIWTTTNANVGSNQIEVRVRDGKHAGQNGFDDRKPVSFVVNALAPQPQTVSPSIQPSQLVPTNVTTPVIPSISAGTAQPLQAANRLPAIQSLTPDKPSPQAAGTVVNWTARATDPDGDQVLYMFFLNSQPQTGWTANNIWVWKTASSNVGNNQIGVWVRDGFHAGTVGSDDRMTVSYAITAPAAPVTPAPVIGPATAPTNITPVQNETSQIATPQTAAPTAGVNTPPKLTGLVPDKPTPQAAGTVINWTASAADPDGDQILYRFFVNFQPQADWTSDNTWTWNTSDVSPGSRQVDVRVRDGKHAGPTSFDDRRTVSYVITAPTPRPPVISPAMAPANITPVQNVTPARNITPTANITPQAVVNTPPVANSLVPDRPSPQVAGTAITWTAKAMDPDGDQILYRFFLKGPSSSGQLVGKTDWTTDNTWVWNTTDADVGSSQIEIRVRDGKHANENGFDSNKAAIFIVTAKPPAPANVTPARNVTIPVNVKPTVNVTAPVVSPAGNNTPPALHSLTSDKSSPQLLGASIVWTANATDPDGDQILYRFFLNGPSTGGSGKPETDWAAVNVWTWQSTQADVGQNQIRVWARDGKHASADSFDSEQAAYFTITAPSKNISGMKFNDQNGNGVKDSNEAGLANWRITLTKSDGSSVGTLTGADGSYKFEGLTPGEYTISETAQTGWTQTAPQGGSQRVTLGGSDVANVNFGNRASTFSILGRKFNDLNGNGVNDGEPGLAGRKIQLSQNGNVVNTTTTGADGSYMFVGLSNGAYAVSETAQSGWTQTAPQGGSQLVTVQDKDITGIDFGNKVSATYSISGTKFNDQNGNGAKDANEPGLEGWNIQLSQGGSVINSTSTAADGSYKFTGLAPGSYAVGEVLQTGWAQTLPKIGSYSVNLNNKDATGLDFGNRGNVTISSKKYFDINGNGIQDSDEPGIPGLTVHLQENGNDIATTTTDNEGTYTFTGLLAGTYTVVDPVPSGFIVTTSSTVTVTVTSTTTIITNANFGIRGRYAISGMKFNDLNGNGVKDAGEPGISGWGIVLTGTTWFGHPLPSQTVETAADGSYTFSGLIPGTYKVSEVSRTGWTQTAPSSGSGSYMVTFNFGAPPTTATGKDFGNRLQTPPGTAAISGVKFSDQNGNGVNDGDPGMAGWTIQLKNATNNTVVRTAITDAHGGYTFLNLPPGGYLVGEVTKSGWTQTAPSGGSYSIVLESSESRIGIDFGNYNPPPTNPTLTPTPAGPRPTGIPVTWTATAQGPNGDPLQYRFFIRAPGGALLSDTNYITSNIWVWNTAGLFPGTYQAEVWIRDGYHAGPNSYDVRTTASFTLTQGNRPPVVDFLFADRPSPEFAGSWIRWTAIAHDPDGDQLQYRYFLRGPSTFGFWEAQTGWTTNSRWLWRTSGFDAGPSDVLVLVRDGHHAGPNGWDDYDVSRFVILAVNTPPVITSLVTSAPSPQPVGAAVSWKVDAFDPDGDLLFYRYWMKGPSTGGLWKLVRDWSTDSTWTWLTTPADVGIALVDVQVRDGFHAGPTGWDDDASALFTILKPNLPPQLTGMVPDKPSLQPAGTPVAWTAGAIDPDGDPTLYRFWLKGPSTGNTWKIVQDWSYSNTWIWASAPGDVGDYSVYVYARDGYHAGPTGYDSALGQRYTLGSPLAERRLTSGAAPKDDPSLIFTGDGYLMAYQSFALGPAYKGDIYLQRFVPSWNQLQSTWAANDTVYEGSPSVIFANVYYYVAYASKQNGVLNIFLKRFDADLNYIDTIQLTDSATDQDSPSILHVGNEFFMAYQSWDTGSQNGGDIFITRFDQNWNPIANIQVTNLISYQDHPSIVFASGNFYVAYTSNETGNKNIFVKRYDPNLNLLDTRRMTYDGSDHDYPSLNWINGVFLLLYDSNKAGTYDVYLDRYLRDWTPVDNAVTVAEPGDQTSSSMAYSTADGLYWVAYASVDSQGQNIYAKPLDLAMPSQLKPCDIVPSFSSTRANSQYTLTLQFYNNYGELADPLDLSFNPPQDSARPTDQLQRVSLGTYQFSSVFGAPGDKSFRIGANIDGCISAKIVPVKVV